MENRLACIAGGGSQSTSPLCFSNHKFPSSIITIDNNRAKISRKPRKNMSIKAFNTGGTRKTLSSNWDIPNLSSLAPTPPKLDELDTTNMLLRQRIIFLGSQVDDLTADFVISQLLFLDAEDPTKDIKLFINSPGGSVTAGMGIYDAMKLCKADVSTICLGLAASMGAFLLATGAKGKRFCMPNGRVMIHQPLGTAGGKATEMSIRIREMNYHKIKLNKIMSRVTGNPVEQIEVDTDRDNFMDAWKAKEYGLVDHVIDDGKPGLVAPLADGLPPPKTRLWDYWKAEGSKKAKKNLPSEHKMFGKNGFAGIEGKDDEGRDKDQEKGESASA
ncbi:ATP-dependent Clp protease proteolytic subunit [Euphorbia peplus]|nr:ATP-dependent Clp protease proteolytic subunit [Euphorbia peplus]